MLNPFARVVLGPSSFPVMQGQDQQSVVQSKYPKPARPSKESSQAEVETKDALEIEPKPIPPAPINPKDPKVT